MASASDIPEVEYIELQTGIDPKHSIIWLHGLGADGHDFEPIVPGLELPAETPVRFIFPHAPVRPITVNGGMAMRGWYDIYEVPLDAQGGRREDRAGLEQSAAIVGELIAQENARGVPTENIILAGFSQGGAIALFAGLRLDQSLAGIIALSTYLPDSTTTEVERSATNNDVPIFMGHGIHDPVIPAAVGERSYNEMTSMGYSVDWRTYEMPHSVHPLEIRDIGNFIKSVIRD